MSNRIPLKITLIYFFIGFLWILFSDQIIKKLADSTEILTQLQTYKGWLFVSITTVLLFLLIRNEINKKNQVENELIKSKAKAEESDQLKSAFLINMSHEIRTPLNGIIGLSELLLDNSFDKNDKQIFARHLSENGNDLLKLINDIMDISKIQENQFEIVRKKFNLNSLLDVIYLEYQQSDLKARRNHIDFKLVKGDEDSEIEIFTDPVRLIHVFQKLLNNAFFFTHEGFIHFGYKQMENKIEFFVEDSGCGIDESNQKMIFKPFFKGKNQIIGSKGFGLGLAISKGLVRLLGGDLQYTSKPNAGSRFYFCIPGTDILSLKPLISKQNKISIKMKAVSLNPIGNKLSQN